MNIIDRFPVPTGDILTVSGEHGLLEMLSVGDYGKDVNVKADHMGLTREPDQVTHMAMLPLEEKWVITISTQYGCSMACTFCDVPKVGSGRNATVWDLMGQVDIGLKLHPEVKSTKRLNIHFARMGEPTWNDNVLLATRYLHITYPQHHLHPVVSTMMPVQNKCLKSFIEEWMRIKNDLCEGEAGLQLSINSTDSAERASMFNCNACSLDDIGFIVKGLVPKGRKITLNFAIAGYIIDPEVLLKHFSPEHFIIKLTPMHKTTSCGENDITTDGDYTTYEPYQEDEEALKRVGYDVLVFIASRAEDEGRITCGNALLSGTRPFGAGVLQSA